MMLQPTNSTIPHAIVDHVSLFGEMCTAHAQKLLPVGLLPSLRRKFRHRAVGFSNSDFPYGTDILAIGELDL